MQFIVLGSASTALAFIRHANKLNATSIIVDTEANIATHSRHCADFKCIDWDVQADLGARRCLEFLTGLARPGGDNYLIGTADRWLHFIVKQREQLERKFKVLQASNSVLSCCLDKLEFYRWCESNGFSVPRTQLDLANENWSAVEQQIPFPMLAKLSDKSSQDIDFPKTLNVENSEQLSELRNRALEGNFLNNLMISESLLNRRLIQCSVPFCSNGKAIISFVAVKERPEPQECKVGSYVTLQHRPDLEEITHQLIKKMDYYGYGELEILYDTETSQYFIIELNARPWTQLELSRMIGYNFLTFLLYDEKQKRRMLKEGTAWVCFRNDFSFFRRSLRNTKKNKFHEIAKFASSYLRVRSCCVFSAGDPKPSVSEASALFTMLIKKLRL